MQIVHKALPSLPPTTIIQMAANTYHQHYSQQAYQQPPPIYRSNPVTSQWSYAQPAAQPAAYHAPAAAEYFHAHSPPTRPRSRSDAVPTHRIQRPLRSAMKRGTSRERDSVFIPASVDSVWGGSTPQNMSDDDDMDALRAAMGRTSIGLAQSLPTWSTPVGRERVSEWVQDTRGKGGFSSFDTPHVPDRGRGHGASAFIPPMPFQSQVRPPPSSQQPQRQQHQSQHHQRIVPVYIPVGKSKSHDHHHHTHVHRDRHRDGERGRSQSRSRVRGPSHTRSASGSGTSRSVSHSGHHEHRSKLHKHKKLQPLPIWVTQKATSLGTKQHRHHQPGGPPSHFIAVPQFVVNHAKSAVFPHRAPVLKSKSESHETKEKEKDKEKKHKHH